jgi:hypothetical protein
VRGGGGGAPGSDPGNHTFIIANRVTLLK